MTKPITYLTILLLITLTAFGQEKGLCKKKVSTTIQNFIKTNYPKAKHLKYYEEKVEEKIFVECEFKIEKTEYSLKFFADTLFETEISIEFTDIPLASRELIQTNLNSLFKEYKILECQEVNPKTNPLYEINIKTKSDDYFELFYDKSGELLEKKDIIIKPIPSQF